VHKDKANEKEEHKKKLEILQKALRLMLIFASLLFVYIFLVGKNAVAFLYTDKWATESSIIIIKVYAFYLGCISLNGIMEAYTNASIPEERMAIFRTSLVFNSVLLMISSIAFTRFHISGLIFSQILCTLIRFLMNLYITIFDDEKFSFFTNVFERIKTIFIFAYNCCYKLTSLLSIIISIVLITLVQTTIQSREMQRSEFILLAISGVIFVVNCLAIYIFEKKDFAGLIRKKN